MTTEKIGRNDICPCGSGKKYKQCCLLREQTKPANSQAMEMSIHRAMHAAWVHYKQGNLPQAGAICQQILRVQPSQPDALHLSGVIALQQGNIEIAVNLIGRAIKANSGNPEHYNNLGLAYHEKGDLDTAIKYYRKALLIAPDYANAAFNLHALMLSKNDVTAAIQHARRVVDINPADSDARFTLGVLLEYSDNTKDAATHFALLENGTNLDRARLDAWRYIKSTNKQLPPIAGSGIQTFKLGLEAAPREGMVLEFGVRFGTSIRQIAALVNQDVHGFDSFEGLPEIWHHEPKGSYTTKGEIPKVPKNVDLHVGWFENTLPEFLKQNSGSVRFINIDCDIYSSTKTVLDLLAPRMVPGSVIVFDEYIGNEHWREDEFKAFQEAVSKYGWTYEYLCFSVFTKQVVVRLKSV